MHRCSRLTSGLPNKEASLDVCGEFIGSRVRVGAAARQNSEIKRVRCSDPFEPRHTYNAPTTNRSPRKYAMRTDRKTRTSNTIGVNLRHRQQTFAALGALFIAVSLIQVARAQTPAAQVPAAQASPRAVTPETPPRAAPAAPAVPPSVQQLPQAQAPATPPVASTSDPPRRPPSAAQAARAGRAPGRSISARSVSASRSRRLIDSCGAESKRARPAGPCGAIGRVPGVDRPRPRS